MTRVPIGSNWDSNTPPLGDFIAFGSFCAILRDNNLTPEDVTSNAPAEFWMRLVNQWYEEVKQNPKFKLK